MIDLHGGEYSFAQLLFDILISRSPRIAKRL
jgi:hypothetical protein